MNIRKKPKIATGIPTASMPDIVFILLTFFMVTTVLKEYEGLDLTLPLARRIEKLETRRHVTYIWISREGTISIDDKLVKMPNVRGFIFEKRVNDPQLVVSLKIDSKAPMGIVSDIHEELREADALQVNYSARTRA